MGPNGSKSERRGRQIASKGTITSTSKSKSKSTNKHEEDEKDGEAEGEREQKNDYEHEENEKDAERGARAPRKMETADRTARASGFETGGLFGLTRISLIFRHGGSIMICPSEGIGARRLWPNGGRIKPSRHGSSVP